MTLGCLRYITEHGLVLGRDIALIGFDDIEILREIEYKLSVVSRSEQGMGEIAMELLLKRLKEPETENRTVVVPTELILRGSERYLKD
jgi:LacI family transcriptional regulator